MVDGERLRVTREWYELRVYIVFKGYPAGSRYNSCVRYQCLHRRLCFRFCSSDTPLPVASQM